MLSQNSDPTTIDRNTGFWYVLFAGSGLIGNLFSYYQFKDSSEIDPDTRFVFVSVLMVIALLGMVVLAFLSTRPPAEGEGEGSNKSGNKRPESPWKGFVGALQVSSEQILLSYKRNAFSKVFTIHAQLLTTREIQLLSCYFVYDGLQFSFYTGVLGPSYSFSEKFNRDDNSMAGLHGIMLFAGQASVGLLYALFYRTIQKYPRYPFVILAVSCHFLCYVLTIINVPADSPMGETSDDAALVTPSSIGIAVFASLVLGVGNGFQDTQVGGGEEKTNYIFFFL